MSRFLLYIHRSVFDPSFYREVAGSGKWDVGWFVIKLILLATVVSGIAHTYYLVDEKRGIAGPLAAALGGMEIKDGRLFPNRTLPYEPPPEQTAAIMNRLFNAPFTARQAAIPALMVDTSGARAASDTPVIILGLTGLQMHASREFSIDFPYANLLWGSPGLQFTKSEIKKFIVAHFFLIFTGFCFLNGVYCAITGFFCICILGFAAYIFRFDRRRPIGYFFKLAGFAITPIPLGVILIALSDVKLAGAWDVLIILSFVVMFRALLAMMKADRAAGAEGGRE